MKSIDSPIVSFEAISSNGHSFLTRWVGFSSCEILLKRASSVRRNMENINGISSFKRGDLLFYMGDQI